MKLLVTYASKYGATAEMAEVIGQELHKRHYEVEVKSIDFHGKIDPDKLNFAERMIVKSVKATVGDYRDWLVIRGWAGRIDLDLKAG